MTSINPSFGNNYNRNIQQKNLSNVQKNTLSGNQKNNNSLNLNQTQSDTVSFNRIDNGGNKEVLDRPVAKANNNYEDVCTADGRTIRYPRKGWKGFVRFGLNALTTIFGMFGLPGAGDMIMGQDITGLA